ncbi:MAG: prepilin-type N-terminal cleavage/methylation domain-containing protein [Acidobacteriota bacterium]|jgi:prepilin-type N-terminal cleavage/methylation domain-containing protein|nr:prepilin-type N-terminal cleavage/methylation domain-containing protein [Acidobacteriota bacterium]
MNQGFTLMELLVASAIGLGILSVVVVNITHSSALSNRAVSQQQNLEALFHTVDTIKSDLTRCGMRLQEAAAEFSIKPFSAKENGFILKFGISGCSLASPATSGDGHIEISGDDFARKRKSILIYSLANRVFECNEISQVAGNRLEMKTPLQNPFPENSAVVVLREIELRFYPRTHQLKRRLDNGYFQPLLENVTDFASTYFPESRSVLYRLEINHREQVRGYIFLNNLVEP